MTSGKSGVPATAKQVSRIRWWAKRIGVDAPSPLTKEQASRLITEWADVHPELEDAWEDHKADEEDAAQERESARREKVELRGERAWEAEVIAGDVDDWREFYRCKKVSKKRVRIVLDRIGSRKMGEPNDQFMDRFFADLRVIHPELFSPSAIPPIIPPSRAGGGFPILGAALLPAILAAVLFQTFFGVAW